jgi:DNA end-binding protein Ku
VFRQIDEVALDPSMVSIAKQILAQHAAPFDPSQFRDRYADAVMAMIDAKRSGARPATKRVPDEREVLDLMDALQRSLTPAPSRAAAARAKRKAAEQPPPRPQKAARRRTSGEGAGTPPG